MNDDDMYKWGMSNLSEEEKKKVYEEAQAYKEALNFLAYIGGRKVE